MRCKAAYAKALGNKFATNTCVIIFLHSIHSLSLNYLGDGGAHIVSEALKTMKNLQHLK